MYRIAMALVCLLVLISSSQVLAQHEEDESGPVVSVVGDLIGRTSNGEEEHARNVFLREAELTLHGCVYPRVHADMTVALEDPEATGKLNGFLEEAYVIFEQIGNTNLSSRLGRNRLDFGLVNKLHPHEWMYVTQPLVDRNFLGLDGLIVQGGSVGYCLRPGSIEVDVQAGVWRSFAHDHGHEEGEEHEFGSGFDNGLSSGRLSLARALSDRSDFRLGFSIASGRGFRENVPARTRDDITIAGTDLTYAFRPAEHKQFLVQAEGMTYRRAGHDSYGWYLFANYQWNECWDFGVSYDWSEQPWPSDGHDTAASAILTNRLNERTTIRLQFTHGSSTEVGTVNEGFLQFIWGSDGHHSH